MLQPADTYGRRPLEAIAGFVKLVEQHACADQARDDCLGISCFSHC